MRYKTFVDLNQLIYHGFKSPVNAKWITYSVDNFNIPYRFRFCIEFEMEFPNQRCMFLEGSPS